MSFSVSKNGLCMWIFAYPFVQNDVFFKVPYILWIWDFVDMYLIILGIRIWSPSIHTYSIKLFFWPPNLCCIPWAHGILFYFIPTLNLMILQIVWNECVILGGHANIQVSYKILWLEVPKKAPILHNLPCFQKGLFWGTFGLNGHWCLGVKTITSNKQKWGKYLIPNGCRIHILDDKWI